jgi:bifunctional non-homologous end joining protein LigD
MNLPFTVPTPGELPATKRGEHWYATTPEREVRLSNLDKVFWPDERYTKGDLLAYYFNVAPLMLPYLRDRPLTMKRMPDGIRGNEFYEKNAPSHTPDWVDRCTIPSEESEKGEINYLMANDTAAMLFVANLGCIEFHPLHSRCARPDLPDYLFFDLDPFEPATFSDVLAIAHHVQAALETLGLKSYPKTSGATGMQIYVPILPGPTYEHVRAFVGTIGRAIRDVDPDRATMERQIPKRAGKVYIDHNMNRMGANIAAVYSIRPEPHAPVSTPLTWDEVAEGDVRPQDFTIATIHDRLAETGDLLRGLLDEPIDLRPSLEQLGLDVPELADPPDPPDLPRVKERLADYDRKRHFEQTPEPPGGGVDTPGNRFVIQKHAATRLHYDLRLEREGVLLSWAVPKGLPTAPGERRLAVRTEDHPLEYLDFEAWIPDGNYGAGEMRIFDRGTYEAPEWEPKKMTVRLNGERLRGEYHLVKTNQDWLIFLSKRTPMPPPPPEMRPMMAEGGHDPFDDPGWTFEPKLDGVRTLAYVSTDGTRLVSRTGRDQTAQYPELANLATYTNAIHAVLDGEIVVLNESGQPSFELLQQRVNLSSAPDIDRARHRHPVYLYVFDILWLDDRDLTSEPLTRRREVLREVVTETGPIGFTLAVEGEGCAFFEAAKTLGIEGIIAKKLDSVYEPGRRTRWWRKIKAMQTLDAVVLGWTPGGGSRSNTFGALLLGAYVDGELRWIGQVGTGFSGRTLADLQTRLEAIETDTPPIDQSELKAVKGARWVRPELVAEVTYLEMTKAGGRLRAPSFRGLRPDKSPEDCVIEQPAK